MTDLCESTFGEADEQRRTPLPSHRDPGCDSTKARSRGCREGAGRVRNGKRGCNTDEPRSLCPHPGTAVRWAPTWSAREITPQSFLRLMGSFINKLPRPFLCGHKLGNFSLLTLQPFKVVHTHLWGQGWTLRLVCKTITHSLTCEHRIPSPP